MSVKIIDSRNDLKKNYGEISIGQYFLYAENLYLKTNILEDDRDPDVWAVRVDTGMKYAIGELVEVIPVNVEIKMC